ncbi:hypothetical protein CDL15_Pgr021963 [Punica granatum]|uniref:Uncharacterized protein n=1 Tax=Punica granatum TaxID=22663 RepID=A0A218WXY0_PUNGR|nr:hypothetical protein CDL15_Pgr021963 [Punica granatum]PKI61308.1 hypothetical protein CRG98_018299 [Punica granatum]
MPSRSASPTHVCLCARSSPQPLQPPSLRVLMRPSVHPRRSLHACICTSMSRTLADDQLACPCSSSASAYLRSRLPACPTVRLSPLLRLCTPVHVLLRAPATTNVVVLAPERHFKDSTE